MAINLDEAFLANTHHAERAARQTGWTSSQLAYAGTNEGGGDGESAFDLNGPAINVDCGQL